MNNEAELAGVLGHEVGHVAARHSAKRQNAASATDPRRARPMLVGRGARQQRARPARPADLLHRRPAADAAVLAPAGDRGRQPRHPLPAGAGYDPRAMSTCCIARRADRARCAADQGREHRDPGSGPAPTPIPPRACARRWPGRANASRRDQPRHVPRPASTGCMYGDDPRAGRDRGQHLRPSRHAA